MSWDAMARDVLKRVGFQVEGETLRKIAGGGGMSAPTHAALTDYLAKVGVPAPLAPATNEPTVELDDDMPRELKLGLQRWRTAKVSEDVLETARLAIGWAKGGRPPTQEEVDAAVQRELREASKRTALVKAIEASEPDAFDQKGPVVEPERRKRR
jgi:hypothetical protein